MGNTVLQSPIRERLPGQPSTRSSPFIPHKSPHADFTSTITTHRQASHRLHTLPPVPAPANISPEPPIAAKLPWDPTTSANQRHRGYFHPNFWPYPSSHQAVSQQPYRFCHVAIHSLPTLVVFNFSFRVIAWYRLLRNSMRRYYVMLYRGGETSHSAIIFYSLLTPEALFLTTRNVPGVPSRPSNCGLDRNCGMLRRAPSLCGLLQRV
ncbi:hypothetical protein BGZ60DRAFT_197572 [Tricladium varicosporioides]|nr:hypothetical protein BGZ60DRAFT_197572 [Hymenoscyphus varicosporioides]